MASLSQDDRDIITKHPLNSTLDRLHESLREVEQSYKPDLISYDGSVDDTNSTCQKAISKLLTTLMGEEAAFNLHSTSRQ